MLVAPRFGEAVVAREIEQAQYRLTSGATEDMEGLGEEVLQTWLFEAHPYGHPVDGRAGVITLLDAARARDFHGRHYLRSAVTAGIAGRYDDETLAAFEAQLARIPAASDAEGDLATAATLPAGPPALVLQQPVPVEGRELLAVQLDGQGTGFHLGHPVTLTRDHEDWPAVHLALSWFGAHRQSHGRLFQELREKRGLNYGTYAYVEPYVQRGWSAMPEQGTVRRQPHFSVWIRPVTPENGPFALKLAVDELERLVADGLTEEQVAETRAYLTRRQPIESDSVDRRLAYALEAAASGMPDPNATLGDRLASLTAADVNAAIARHLRPQDLRIVAISGNAEELVARLVEESATPIVYASVTPSEDQATTDARVAEKGLDLAESHVVSSQGIFQ
ncbi:MAG: insulinase family protein [Deltaproteobacteria bacterium]|nr:MAG: insulinase family protein [Deltaproteobacteria bacterium]